MLSIKALFDAGLIKHWGVSNENAYGITMFCVTCDKLGVPRPVSCQNDFSLCDRMYENDTAEAAYRFGVVGLPYGTLAGAWPRPPPTHTHGPALAGLSVGQREGKAARGDGSHASPKSWCRRTAVKRPQEAGSAAEPEAMSPLTTPLDIAASGCQTVLSHR